MRTTVHGQNLIQLTRYPRIFPVNCYLVREEDGFTLIDAGLPGSEEAILEGAREHGGIIRRIALTHAHGDHVGSLDALHSALPDAEVLIPAREARFLAGDMSLDPEEPQAKLRGGWRVCETRPTRLLSSGERMGSLEVVASPGHTPGHVAFLDTRDGTLIAGDAFQTRAGVAVSGTLRLLFPFPALATWHEPTALKSAQILRALGPSRLAVGHGEVLEDPLGAMDRAIAASERRVAGRSEVEEPAENTGAGAQHVA
jgi:glyoxylase-like metal-dependent hydrolase (beta-lactamase superfamily II)